MVKLVFVLSVLYTTGPACSPDDRQLLQVEGRGSAAAYCTVAKTGTAFIFVSYIFAHIKFSHCDIFTSDDYGLFHI